MKVKKKTATKVYRTDSIKLNKTYYTEEGYLIDHPVVTTCGVFEYANPDGSVRRELRLPDHVFAPESLASYQGKPIIVTHDAGEVNKSNVRQEQIGTVLSAGYQDGDNVRCKIVIHDTDALKKYGLRELSLGYALTTIDEPGTYKGEDYDCIQTNIEINHLALVSEARAGEAARLNIDSKDKKYLKGGLCNMKSNAKKKNLQTKKATQKKSRYDGDLTPEELASAIALYKAQNGMEDATQDEDDTNLDADEVVQNVKDRKDRRDSEEDTNLDADEVIAEQEADIEALLGVIDELQAAGDMAQDEDDVNSDEDDTNSDEDDINDDEDDTNTDEDDIAEDEDDVNSDEDDETNSDEDDKSVNADGVDRLVNKKMRDYLDMCRVADKLNLDGVENLSLIAGRKKIIRAVKPKLNLDGKSASYVKAAYDIAKQEVAAKGRDAQRKAMMSKKLNLDDSDGSTKSGADVARARMINRLGKQGGKK